MIKVNSQNSHMFWILLYKTFDLNKLNRMKNGLRINNSALTLERNALLTELQHIKSMSMFEFGNQYCSSESLEADGHAFARSLGVGK